MNSLHSIFAQEISWGRNAESFANFRREGKVFEGLVGAQRL
jgi:hypothetical protein